MFIQEREKAQAACQKEKETLSAQLQEKAARIIQVCGKYFKLSAVLLQMYFNTVLLTVSRYAYKECVCNSNGC